MNADGLWVTILNSGLPCLLGYHVGGGVAILGTGKRSICDVYDHWFLFRVRHKRLYSFSSGNDLRSFCWFVLGESHSWWGRGRTEQLCIEV